MAAKNQYRSSVSGYASTEEQLTFWDEPLGNHGHVRTVIGRLVEELTAEFVGGKRHRTDSQSVYCPDVSRRHILTDYGVCLFDTAQYFESKSAGNSKQTFVYTGRLVKDRAFVDLGNELYYVVWHHRAHSKEAKTISQLEWLVGERMREVYVVPFGAFEAVCLSLKVEPLNSQYYGPAATRDQKETYGSGYRVPLKLIEAYRVRSWDNGISRPLERGW